MRPLYIAFIPPIYGKRVHSDITDIPDLYYQYTGNQAFFNDIPVIKQFVTVHR